MEKNKIGIFLIAIGLLVMSGCGNSSAKATHEMLCTMTSSLEEQELSSEIYYTYNEEEFVESNSKHIYSSLKKSETTAKIYEAYAIRHSMLSDIDGVDVAFDENDNGFSFQEKWEYKNVDMSKIKHEDSLQSNFIDNDKYSIDKVRSFYEGQGYSCSTNELE